MNKRVLICRHGESDSNSNAPTSSPWDIALTRRGQEQAQSAAASIADQPDVILSSRMKRARDTAAHFSKRWPHVPVEAAECHEFVYLVFPGTTTPEERRPLVTNYWERADPFEKSSAEDSESFIACYQRTQQFHDQLIESQYSMIVVVSHGFFTQVLLHGMSLGFPQCDKALMKEIYAQSKHAPIQNCQIVELDLK